MAFPARIRFGVEHVERDWLEHGTELHNFKVGQPIQMKDSRGSGPVRARLK